MTVVNALGNKSPDGLVDHLRVAFLQPVARALDALAAPAAAPVELSAQSKSLDFDDLVVAVPNRVVNCPWPPQIAAGRFPAINGTANLAIQSSAGGRKRPGAAISNSVTASTYRAWRCSHYQLQLHSLKFAPRSPQAIIGARQPEKTKDNPCFYGGEGLVCALGPRSVIVSFNCPSRSESRLVA
jgi:hypothetical protein